MDDTFKEGLKIVAGTVGAFVGGLLMKIGWGRAKRGRTMLSIGDDALPPQRGRIISSKEWHDLRDRVNKVVWEVEALKRDIEQLEARVDSIRGRQI